MESLSPGKFFLPIIWCMQLFVKWAYRYLDALYDIYQAYEYLTNHPNIRERTKLLDLYGTKIKSLVNECTKVLSSYLKGEKVWFILW